VTNNSRRVQKPLLLVERYAEEVQALHEKLEPAKNRVDKGDLEASYAQNPLWGTSRPTA